MEKISTIIPAYNRHPLTIRHVEECLKSIRLPDEIIVVNDGGADDLKNGLISLIRPPQVKIIYARITEDILWNYNGACNLGVWLSTGDIIAIEDTDHIPDRNAYTEALNVLQKNPECDRVGMRRKVIDIKGIDKPMEEWVPVSGWGSNQMVTLFRRDMYLRLKGQDERFARHYGWMAYDWKYRRDNLLFAKTITTGYYWAIIGDGGEPNLKRGLSIENRKIYKENAIRGHIQHPHGILNFEYTFDVL